MVKIRAATEADADAINAVSAHLGYATVSAPDALTSLTAVLESEHDSVYLASVNGETVGWVHVFRALRVASPSFLEIGGLVVDPAYRRQGIGEALVQHATINTEETVRVRCREDRSESHQFYESLGFVVTKSQRVFARSGD